MILPTSIQPSRVVVLWESQNTTEQRQVYPSDAKVVNTWQCFRETVFRETHSFRAVPGS